MNENTQLATSECVSVVSVPNKGGRPRKYRAETVERLLTALADGLTQKQACAVCGIGVQTLRDWRQRYRELEPRVQQAREQARQKALAGIKAAGEAGDWRALQSFLRFAFHADYRQNPNVNVTATAVAAQQQIVTEEQRKKLIEMREKILQTTSIPCGAISMD